MKIPIINNEEIIEGIVASIFFPITILFFKNFEKDAFIKYSILSWFTTWVLRKMAVNIYKVFVKKYKFKNYYYSIYI